MSAHLQDVACLAGTTPLFCGGMVSHKRRDAGEPIAHKGEVSGLVCEISGGTGREGLPTKVIAPICVAWDIFIADIQSRK